MVEPLSFAIGAGIALACFSGWWVWNRRPLKNPMMEAERLIDRLDSGRENFINVDTRIGGERCTVKADWRLLSASAKDTIRIMLRQARTNSEMKPVVDTYNDSLFKPKRPK